MMQMLKGIRNKLSPLFMSKKERRHAKVGPAHLWRMKRDFQIKFLKDHGLAPTDRLLDLGCGTLRGGIPMIAYLEEGKYTGIDVRDHVLREAHKELDEAGLTHKDPTLVLAEDLTQLQLDSKFDYVWSFSVLFHMSDDVLAGALSFVRDHLAPDGRMYANVMFGDRPDGTWQGMPVVTRSLAFYQDAAQQAGLACRHMGVLGEIGYASGDEDHDEKHMLELTHRDT